METIEYCTLDNGKPTQMGKVKVIGKQYPENEYDDGACLKLQDDEVLLIGKTYRVRLDYYSEGEEIVPYYLVEPPEFYNAKIDADILSGKDGTFTVEDTNGDQFSITCSGQNIPSGKKAVEGLGYIIAREESNKMYQLVIVDGAFVRYKENWQWQTKNRCIPGQYGRAAFRFGNAAACRQR
jgi:hypothetical protein